jgi:hypothetical protein
MSAGWLAKVPMRELRRESWMVMGWAAPHGRPYWSVKLTPVWCAVCAVCVVRAVRALVRAQKERRRDVGGTPVELYGEGQVGASSVDDPLHEQLRLAAAWGHYG